MLSKQKKRKLLLFSLIITYITLFSMLSCPKDAFAETKSSQKKESYLDKPKKNHSGYMEKRLSIISNNDACNIEVYYPSIGAALVDSDIYSWASHQVALFENGVREISRDEPGSFSLYIDYKHYLPSLRCASFVFTIKTNIASKTADIGLITITYQIQEGRRLFYEDIFAKPDELIQFLSKYSRQALRFRDWHYPDAVFVDSGTLPNEINFRSFAITNAGMNIFFPPNQVAPAYEGTVQVFIPLSKLMHFGPQLAFWGLKEKSDN